MHRSPSVVSQAVEEDVSGLSPRGREILRDIIHTFVVNGEPVSSRTVSKHVQHGLSAASIRNVMADLEELGYLRQPHTSAGRVPTESAYRLYIQSLMETRLISPRDRRYIDEQVQGAEGDELMTRITHLLSELSHHVGIVLKPAVEDTTLKAIHFVSLGPTAGGRNRLLCVLVSTTDFVDNLVLDTEEILPAEDLLRISNFATENFRGLRLVDLRNRLLESMADERRGLDRWLTRTMTLAEQVVRGAAGQEVLVEGANSLIGQPEIADLEKIRRMLEMFADKALLIRLLNHCLEAGGGVRVFLGHDSELTAELELGLVSTTYGAGDKALGTIGILGPARMEYPRIVPLVRYLGDVLSRALSPASRHPTQPSLRS